MRKLAYTFGKQLRADQGSFDSLHEALDLNGFKGTCKTEAAPLTEEQLAGAKNFAEHTDMTVPEGAIFVSPDGDDGAEGTIVSPLQSIQLACDRAAATIANTVVLREGTHYLPETIFLGAEHSGLTMQAHPGEKAVVSGGKELKVTWKKSTTAGTGDNIYVADISGQVTDVPGLQIDGKRATRARYPNLPGGLEASCGYGCMVPSNAADWTPPDFNKFGQVTYYTDNQTRTDRERRSSLCAGIRNPCPQSVSSKKLCCTRPRHALQLVPALLRRDQRPLLRLHPARLVLVLRAHRGRRRVCVPHSDRHDTEVRRPAAHAVQGRVRGSGLCLAAGALGQLVRSAAPRSAGFATRSDSLA